MRARIASSASCSSWLKRSRKPPRTHAAWTGTARCSVEPPRGDPDQDRAAVIRGFPARDQTLRLEPVNQSAQGRLAERGRPIQLTEAQPLRGSAAQQKQNLEIVDAEAELVPERRAEAFGDGSVCRAQGDPGPPALVAVVGVARWLMWRLTGRLHRCSLAGSSL